MQPRRPLTIAHANAVLLVSMVSVLVGSFVASGLPTYQVLSIREGLFILLPACALVLLLKLPAREKAHLVRLRPPGARVVAMSALIGLGGWLFDSWLGVLLSEGLGYTTPLPPDFFPTAPGGALFLLVVLALLAPICEEMLFRGVIQRGYEELSPRAGILAGGALFALFHQSLPQGLALLPLAFVLGYLVWRSDSLWAGIVAHATNNALAGALIVMATSDPEVAPWIGTLPVALLGAAGVAAGLWGLRRWTVPPPALNAAPQGVAPAGAQHGRFRFWLVRLWPLLLILPIAAFSIGLEALLGWFPETLALGQPVRWSVPSWEGTRTWTYEIRNALQEPVGQARCVLALDGTAYLLDCRRQQSAFEVSTGSDVYRGGDVREQFTARWQRSDLRLSAVDRRTQIATTGGETATIESSVVPERDAVEVVTRREDGAPQRSRLLLEPTSSPLWPGRSFEPVALESSEWPWRLSALPFSGFYSARATLIDLDTWPEAMGEGGPTASPTYVVIYGAEPIKTPSGTYIAWQVRVGDDHTAWYDVERPHALVALENGMETWVLTSVE